jgi:hypothetical protein
MHGLSARTEIRGKRATKNLRKLLFPEVLFGLLASTNRRFCRFYEVFFDLLARTNRSVYKFSRVFFGLFPIVEGLGRVDSSTTELYDDVNA